ncbi:hypothetical protein AB0C28_16495 [Nonomuraea sp. NPDC048892]|uniref:hypothetical protein n=1 Tax=Nonomuraea sp. NPDC048892 TaxID=3154624 RepID=UPI0033EA0175
MAVLLLGTFDTQGAEYAHVRDLIMAAGQTTGLSAKAAEAGGVDLIIRNLRGNPRLQAEEKPDPCGAAQEQMIRHQPNRRIEQARELSLIVW